jgi:hypothetical protein
MRRGLALACTVGAAVVLATGCGSSQTPADGPTNTVAPEDLSPEAQKSVERSQQKAIKQSNKGPDY